MLSNTSFLGLRVFGLDRVPFHFQVIDKSQNPAQLQDGKVQSDERAVGSVSKLAIDTTHLTGLRGIAALIVYNWHILLPFCPQLFRPYVNYRESSIFQLPFIRISVYGVNAVYFFSCLSGYVQSLKPLTTPSTVPLAQQSKQATRTTVRRLLLQLATIIPVTLISLVGVLADVYRFVHLGSNSPSFLKDVFPIRQPTVMAQIYDWLSFNSLMITGIWTGWIQPASNYGPHLWSVPPDLRASLLLTPFLSCCNQLTANTKTIVAATTGVVLSYIFPDYGAGLISTITYLGAVLACLTTAPLDQLNNTVLRIVRSLSWPLLIGSIYVASLPIVTKDSVAGTGINPLLYSTSPAFSLAFGIPLLSSILILAPPDPVRRFLNWNGIQELGKVSFSFYLIHQAIVHFLGYPAVKYLHDSQGWPVVPSVAFIGLALFPVTLKAAYFFDDYVTQPLRRLIARNI